MSDNTQDVKAAESQAASESTEKQEQSPEVSQDVQKGGDVVSKTAYEKVRDDMKSYRENFKEAKSESAKLQEQIDAMNKRFEAQGDDDQEDVKPPQKDFNSELSLLVYKDDFVKNNLEAVEAHVRNNSFATIGEAVKDLKADMFSKHIVPEMYGVNNQTITQEAPSASPEVQEVQLSGNYLKDMSDGKLNMPTEQQQAIQRKLDSLKKRQ